MNISGLLGTFASSLSYYIDEFQRITLHISNNLPLIGNQIECHVNEARDLVDSDPKELGQYGTLLDHMSAVRVPIFEIIIELQKEDIINQQMNHLFDAVSDVQKIIDENKVLFVDYSQNVEGSKYREEYRHIFTLISFLLNILEKQMTKINKDLVDLITIMENQFTEMKTLIDNLHNSRQSTQKGNQQFSKSVKSILNITENLSGELEQYGNFFERLKLLQDDMNREVSICTNLKKEVNEDLQLFGGNLSLNKCKFNNTIIQKIVIRLSVEEERQTLREEFSELSIEESAGSNIVLF